MRIEQSAPASGDIVVDGVPVSHRDASGDAINDVRPVALGLLKIDPAVQRTRLDEGWVLWLVEHWDWRKVGVLVVSVRADGSLIVLNGWHRLSAMRELVKRGGRAHTVMCELLYGLTPEDEARVFLGRNDSRGVHVIDRYKARVRAGDGVATDVRDILARQGACVDFATDVGYACVSTLERLYHHGVLEQAVVIIERCWASSEPRLARTTVTVEGVGLFLRNYAHHRSYDVERALAKFGAAAPVGRHVATLADLVRQSKALSSTTGDAIYVEFARLLRTRYNHQVRNRLPEVEPLGR